MFSIPSWNRSFIVLTLLAGATNSVSAAGGTIRFSGAITEPACTVNRSTPTMAIPASLASRTQAAGTKVDLAVRCNTQQSVQILFEDINSDNGRGTFNAGNGAEVVLSYANKAISPGDSIRYAFIAKKEAAISLSTSLRQGNSTETSKAQSNIMVSFNYQ